MSEEPQSQPPIDEDAPPDVPNLAVRRRWRIFGWTIIGLMISVIVLNLAGFVYPDVNKGIMIVLVAAYLVYVIFRRR